MNNDFLQTLSRQLVTTLDIAGASEYVRKIRQHTALANDVLTTLVMLFEGNNVAIHTFGSSSEGTTTPGLGSDTDTMMCFCMFPVFEMDTDVTSEDFPDNKKCIDNNGKYKNYILMVEDNNTPTGFTKLAFVGDEASYQQYSYVIQVAQDVNGKRVLTNRGMIGAMTSDELNGPAATTLKRPGFTDLDYIPAFRCKKWPRAAGEFLTRKRKHEFPSSNVGKDFGNLGIFLVPTGHAESSERNLQWRLSFSLQERKIMNNLNEAQYKCYILLKMMKQDFIKPKVPEKSLTSYHCKTSMFFVMEEYGNSVWTIHNLVEYFIKCVRLLWSWIDKGFIPSYFMPTVNLWKGGNEIRCKVFSILTDILQDVPKSFMFFRCDDVGKLLQKSVDPSLHHATTGTYKDYEVHNYLRFAKRDLHLAVHRLHLTFIGEAISMTREFLQSTRKGDDLDRCIVSHRRLIDMLENTTELSKLTSQDKANADEAMSFILPFVFTSLGSQLATKAICTSDDHLNDGAMLYLHKGINSDNLSGKLKLAVVLYAQKKYEECLRLLEDLDENMGNDVVTLSMCSRDPNDHNITMRVNEALVTKILNEKPTTKDVLLGNIATCVYFLPTELPLIPKDLQYEMFRSFGSNTWKHPDLHKWYDNVVVDSKVLLFYLKYLVHEQLGNEREKNVAFLFLYAAIENDHNLCHFDTANNILGCIFRDMGHPDLAFSSFYDSWRRKADHNAAKWHALITCFKFLRDLQAVLILAFHVSFYWKLFG